jgi:hypothetical protein
MVSKKSQARIRSAGPESAAPKRRVEFGNVLDLPKVTGKMTLKGFYKKEQP